MDKVRKEGTGTVGKKTIAPFISGRRSTRRKDQASNEQRQEETKETQTEN